MISSSKIQDSFIKPKLGLTGIFDIIVTPEYLENLFFFPLPYVLMEEKAQHFPEVTPKIHTQKADLVFNPEWYLRIPRAALAVA